MEFIEFILLFGFGFVLMAHALQWALPILFIEKVENPCEGLHNWHYTENGRLQCMTCKFYALDDE